MNKPAQRRNCKACNGLGYVEVALNVCKDCNGTAYSEARCVTCATWKVIKEFVTGHKVAKQCSACRNRYVSGNSYRAGINSTGELRVKLAVESGNRKTGPIPVSMTSANTCPLSCPFLNAGCYAEGHLVAMHWRRVSAGDGITWSEFCVEIAKLPKRQIWRHNEAGDLPGNGEAIDAALLSELVAANRGKRGFTYTHKRPDFESNAALIRLANLGGFAVNLSADTIAEADQFVALGIAPVTVVLPHDTPDKAFRTPAGNQIVICPAEHKEKVSCATCKLCAVSERKSIVAFRAHGDRKHAITKSIRQLPMFSEVNSQ